MGCRQKKGTLNSIFRIFLEKIFRYENGTVHIGQKPIIIFCLLRVGHNGENREADAMDIFA